jgi:hypothetical protein
MHDNVTTNFQMMNGGGGVENSYIQVYMAIQIP